MNTVPTLACDIDYGLEPEMPPADRAARRLMWGLLHFMWQKGFKLYSVEGEGGEGEEIFEDLGEAMNEIFSYNNADLTFKQGDDDFMMRVIPGNDLDCVISDWLIPKQGESAFDAAIKEFNTTVWSYA